MNHYTARNLDGLCYIVGINKDLEEAKKHTLKCIRENKDDNYMITSSDIMDSKSNTLFIKMRLWEFKRNKLVNQ